MRPFCYTALTGVSMMLLSGIAEASGGNPLFDFQSNELTSEFQSAYSGVSGATVNKDVPYGLDDAQKYDVYMPSSRSSAPIIVMIHGGDWTSGDKGDASTATDKAGYWVAKGFVFVSLNYRLLPKKDPLVQAADVALAIASIQKAAPNWGADPAKVVLMGAGAGGHLAALLTSNPSLASDQGASPWKGAVVLETPALNIPAIMSDSPSSVYTNAFGSSVEYWEDASPANLVASTGLPMLVVCSTQSTAGSCDKANAFKQTANGAGVKVTVMQEPLATADVNAKLGVAGTYSDNVDAFIESLL